jgi:glutamate racemase
MKRSFAPIGVFDSGVGGLTVLKALRERLPTEDFVYLGDTARFPYGRKPKDMIAGFSRQNARFLESQGVKAVVIACNTASSCALPEIDVPVFEVIEPGVAAAKAAFKGGVIGVVATKGTIHNAVYQKRLEALGLSVWARACPMLAPLVEEGLAAEDEAILLIEHYLKDRPVNLDALVLGCTHYPVLKAAFQAHLGGSVEVVDSASTTAERVAAQLEARGFLSTTGRGEVTHFVTGDPQSYQHTASVIGGVDGEIHHLEIEELLSAGSQRAERRGQSALKVVA